MGAKGKEGLASLMGTGGGGGGAGGLGAGAGSYSLGAKAFEAPSAGMSSELGGGSAATTGESAASFAGPAVALGAAGYGEYQAMKNPSLRGRMTGNRDISQTGEKIGRGLSNLPSIGKGLSLTGENGGNKMPAIERRYQNSQNAMSSIDEAQKALSEAQLPDAERRSIYQKLELAKQSGGKKRGSSIYS